MPAALASALLAALREPEESRRLAAGAFHLVRAEYSRAQAGDAWDRLLRDVAAGA